MKNNLLLALLLSFTGLWAQNKIGSKVSELQKLNANFKQIAVLSPNQNITDAEINKVVDGATLATVNFEKINEIVSNQYETVELVIPYQNQNVNVLLYKVNPFVEGFHIDTDKAKNINYQKGVYYRGIINGDTKSLASFNFFNGEFNGIISSSALGNVVVGKLDKANNQTDYIVYSDAKLKILNDFDCHVKDDNLPVKKDNGITNRNINSDRCVSFYFEIDNDIYTQNGSNETTTTNWMTSVFNNVQTLYANDGITVGLKSMYIWTEQDPYEGIGDSSSDYLNLFSETTPVFDGDVGQLIGIDPGGLGGVAAAIDGMCSMYNYSYSDVNITYSTVPTYSWTVQVITHEFGHLLGSPHTHACVWNGNNTAIDNCAPYALGQSWEGGSCMTSPATIPSSSEKGTIMSYCHLISGVGISFNNGFGPQPTARILDAVENSLCLSTDCVNTCINMVVDLGVTSVTSNSVAFAWSDLSSVTSWQVAVTPFSSTNITWTTVNEASYSVSGLNPNTYYVIRVRPLCTDATAPSRIKIFGTAATNLCSFSFTDTGGTSGNYTNMESWVRTMMPTGPGLKVKVTFNSFNLEEDYDYLYIFNGADEFFADLTGGGLTGTGTPSSYTSTANSGALTFKFVSDEGVVAQGWNANITCTGTLGNEDVDILDFSYYPNPTTGKVNITSKDAISEVAVFNVQGQLLYNQKLNELATSVDISQFATGTYFFKLKINEKEANFKIVKM